MFNQHIKKPAVNVGRFVPVTKERIESRFCHFCTWAGDPA
jgi:hypothetical protein